ncbi:MAG TPA: DUF2897 family protein [Steroidobacteraceae bacterium]|jgi:hypothetical protein
MKVFLIILLALAFVAGGLLAFKSSAKSGQPSEDVIERAKQRERQLDEEDKREDR